MIGAVDAAPASEFPDRMDWLSVSALTHDALGGLSVGESKQEMLMVLDTFESAMLRLSAAAAAATRRRYRLLTVALQRFNSKGRSLLQVMGLFL